MARNEAHLKIIKDKPSPPTALKSTYDVPVLASFKVAAHHLGASSGAALRMRFERGTYPQRFLVKLTPSKPGVDLHGILEWIRNKSKPSSNTPNET